MVLRNSDGVWSELIMLSYRQPVPAQSAAIDVRAARPTRKKDSTIHARSHRPPHAHTAVKGNATETTTLSHLDHRGKQERSLPTGTISNGRYARCQRPAGPPSMYGGGARHRRRYFTEEIPPRSTDSQPSSSAGGVVGGGVLA